MIDPDRFAELAVAVDVTKQAVEDASTAQSRANKALNDAKVAAAQALADFNNYISEQTKIARDAGRETRSIALAADTLRV